MNKVVVTDPRNKEPVYMGSKQMLDLELQANMSLFSIAVTGKSGGGLLKKELDQSDSNDVQAKNSRRCRVRIEGTR